MKKQHLVWQQELQGPPEKAVEHAKGNLDETCQEASGFTSLLLSDACQCPHLEKWLPNLLDLDFCKSVSGPRSQPLLIQDPIHALHLSSQLEENSTVLEQNYRNMGTSPWIYGEEQQRTVAFSQAGIPESFFPLTQQHLFHEFNTPNPDAPKPLHADSPVPVPPSKPVATTSANATTALTSATNTSTSNQPKPSTTLSTSGADKPQEAKPTAAATATTTSSTTDTTETKPGAANKQSEDETKPKESSSTKADDNDKTKKPDEIRSATPSVSFASPIVQTKDDGKNDENNAKTATTTAPSSSAAGEMKQEDTAETNKTTKEETTTVKKDDTTTTTNPEESGNGTSKNENDANKSSDGVKDVEMKDVVDDNETNNKKVKEDNDEKEDKKDDTKGKEDNQEKGDDKKEGKEDDKKEEKEVKHEEKEDGKHEEKEGKPDDEKEEKEDMEGNKQEEKEDKEGKGGDLAEKSKDTSGETKDEEMKDVSSTKDGDNDKKEETKEENKQGEEADVKEGASTKDESLEAKDGSQGDGNDGKKPAIKEEEAKSSGSGMQEDAKKDDNAKVEDKASDQKESTSEIAAKTKDEKVDGVEQKAKDPKTDEDPKKDDVKIELDVSKPPSTESKQKPSAESSTSAPSGAATVTAKSTDTKQETPSAPPAASTTATNTSSAPNQAPSATATTSSAPEYLLSEARYMEISRQEDQIKVIRNLLAKRVSNTKKKGKKRKSDAHANNSANSALQNLPGSLQYTNERAITDLTAVGREEWLQTKATACRKVEGWLEQFRSSRRSYWEEESMIQQRNTKKQKISSSLSAWTTTHTLRRTCQMCENPRATGDEIMQCLECTFVGCGPASVCHQSDDQHILQHMLLTGHKFAVTCGARAEVFCFSCGDFVYHKVFDQERERLDLAAKIPWLAWNDHALRRSFDPLHFVRVEEYGIIWRGLMASYPPLVPKEHVDAARYCLQRQAVFEGHLLNSKWPLMGRRALDFAIYQNKQAPPERWRIPLPVGMYNLGNTCFMSSIIQCLIHCVPLQRYFLKDIGHNHKACKTYRNQPSKEKHSPSRTTGPITDDGCLACEMDALFLDYYRRSTGRDVVGILEDLAVSSKTSVADMFADISRKDEESIPKGEPIVIGKMMHVAWKSSGMNHLAGYEQRDAHEFLHAFLDILGKQICQHRARVDEAIDMARSASPFSRKPDQGHHDIIKHLFEGTLRSVLVCEECGSKRTLSEAFLNVSLPLSKELMMNNPVGSDSCNNLNLSRCLEHFTAPEKLADPVDCPACGKKTPTKKQHTISRLPRVLCIHLKRFHAALNKKIEDFVAFPAHGLNMGPHLPHWREVTTVPDSKRKPTEDGSTNAAPEILYDLFGTVNHRGGLQSGHYIVDLKVQDQWFSINDQHVGISNEANVLGDSGAYILFYTRRS